MSRTIVITGASRGLGLALVKDFLRAGDHVFTLSRTLKNLKALETSSPGTGKLSIHKVDVTSEAQVKDFFSKLVKKKKKTDVLINNAGYGGKLSRVENTSLYEFQKFQDANLKSAFLLCKYALPLFQKQKKGIIINVSSMAGVRGVPKLFAYSSSKFGMLALTQCIVKENDHLPNFKCFTIAPGGMNTKMRSDIFGKKDAAAQQSPEFVGGIIQDVISNRIPVNSGSTIVIRHGKISNIIELPGR